MFSSIVLFLYCLVPTRNQYRLDFDSVNMLLIFFKYSANKTSAFQRNFLENFINNMMWEIIFMRKKFNFRCESRKRETWSFHKKTEAKSFVSPKKKWKEKEYASSR